VIISKENNIGKILEHKHLMPISYLWMIGVEAKKG